MLGLLMFDGAWWTLLAGSPVGLVVGAIIDSRGQVHLHQITLGERPLQRLPGQLAFHLSLDRATASITQQMALDTCGLQNPDRCIPGDKDEPFGAESVARLHK